MAFLRKYGVATHIYVPIIKRAVVDFAVAADYTVVAADVKISKDGGAAANTTNVPVAITMGNGAIWDFSLTATEMQAAQVIVTVVDAATKAVEDQSFIIETYGNASAQHAVDFSDIVRAGLTALPNAAAEAAGGLFTRGSGAGQLNQQANGQLDANVARWLNTAPVTPLTSGVPLVDTRQCVRVNTAQAGTASTITLDASASAVDSFYNYSLLTILSGTGAGQTKLITAYVGATKVATVAPSWATNPDNTSVFAIIGASRANVGLWLDSTPNGMVSGRLDAYVGAVVALESLNLHSGTAQAGAAGTITLAAGASAVDSLYVGEVVKIYGGTGAGQARVITAYVGATKVATVGRNWTTAPDATSTYAVLSLAVPKVNDSLEVISSSVTGAVASVTAPVTTTFQIKKNVARAAFEVPMYDSADHVTLKTGLTVAGTVSLDGGAFGALTNAVSEIGTTGIYKVDLAAADLNGNVVMLRFTAAGADTSLCEIITQT